MPSTHDPGSGIPDADDVQCPTCGEQRNLRDDGSCPHCDPEEEQEEQ